MRASLINMAGWGGLPVTTRSNGEESTFLLPSVLISLKVLKVENTRTA